ncbi:MAG: septal ring lytic transglycosylase RlpA family protein [Candidatus Omnitrophica bacterium]|nr:septal ring lytic transglycosylase RlpA family protein [Candidatus Omnitrophota bacterium]MDD5436656.1 septal ring lytic transglycosylase RlpA family protein [Candidatus Omnitrophota bacterium]
MNTQKIMMTIAVILLTTILSLGEKPLATATVNHDGTRIITKEGVASYYSYECAALPMANGKPFNPENRTCASWFYKFGTVLKVKSLDTGRMTEVVVTDRGPNKRLVKEGRIIDLSKRAFQDICPLKKGLTKVVVAVKR